MPQNYGRMPPPQQQGNAPAYQPPMPRPGLGGSVPAQRQGMQGNTPQQRMPGHPTFAQPPGQPFSIGAAQMPEQHPFVYSTPPVPQPAPPGMVVAPVQGPPAPQGGGGFTMNPASGGGGGSSFKPYTPPPTYNHAMSDASSKTKIRELEDELQKTYAALGGGSTAVMPDVGQGSSGGGGGFRPVDQPGTVRQLDTGNPYGAPDARPIDKVNPYEGVGSYQYEYKDPSMPGAQAGQQSGPMADELKSLPGVVQPGADGYDRVDTQRLSLNNASALGAHERKIADLEKQLDALRASATNGNIEAGLGKY